MTRKPAAAKARPTPPAAPGRPTVGARKQVAARYPQEVWDGLARQAVKDGISINDAYIKAALNYGDFPNGRPDIKREKVPVAAKVATSTRPPEVPGARLDKKAIGRRSGAKAAPRPNGAAPPPAAAEAVEEAV